MDLQIREGDSEAKELTSYFDSDREVTKVKICVHSNVL